MEVIERATRVACAVASAYGRQRQHEVTVLATEELTGFAIGEHEVWFTKRALAECAPKEILDSLTREGKHESKSKPRR